MYNFDILKNGTKAYIIDEQGREHEIDLYQIDYYVAEAKCTVKVEGMESHYTEYFPSTVHVYISPKGAKSFKTHTDPYDVKIHCVEGIKTMIIDNNEIQIKEGETIKIPANLPHKATNQYDSIMLSIGYE